MFQDMTYRMRMIVSCQLSICRRPGCTWCASISFSHIPKPYIGISIALIAYVTGAVRKIIIFRDTISVCSLRKSSQFCVIGDPTLVHSIHVYPYFWGLLVVTVCPPESSRSRFARVFKVLTNIYIYIYLFIYVCICACIDIR